jgi:peptidylprolyl isomerase
MQAKQGDTVHVHYTGSFDDGEVFDSSNDSEPLEFTIGAGQVIPGFEEAVVGMTAGDKKNEHITAARAYGERNDQLLFTVGRDQLPSDAEVAVGDMLQVGFPDGRTAPVQVTALTDDTITLDANHPLAGRNLNFALELVKIK